MTSSAYSLYDHEADIGVHGIGPTKAEAFAQAAIALLSIITEPDRVTDCISTEIECEAPDDELLFVDWLNALIYAMSRQKLLFRRFDITIEGTRLHATAWGEKIDRDKHQPAVEIKGATYTTLHVFEDDKGNWHAQTVVDV